MGSLLGRKRELDLEKTVEPSIRSPRLPQGAIQGTTLEVLAVAAGPLRAREIQARVEMRLGRPVSRDTVSSFLSVACREGKPTVMRIGYGRYQIAR